MTRDELLALSDGELESMKAKLTNEVASLRNQSAYDSVEFTSELSKLEDKLNRTVAQGEQDHEAYLNRKRELDAARAEANEALEGSLEDIAAAQGNSSNLQAELAEMLDGLKPVLEALLVGASSCQCPEAVNLFNRLQVASAKAGVPHLVDLSGLASGRHEATPHRSARLLRQESRIATASGSQGPFVADVDPHYELVREVEGLLQQREDLKDEQTNARLDYSTQQSALLDRIDAARIAADRRRSWDRQYEDLNSKRARSTDRLKNATELYIANAQGKLDRLQQNSEAVRQLAQALVDELKRCGCA